MSQSGSLGLGGGGGGDVTSVTGSNGVTASPTTAAVVVSGVNATTSTVGVASFNPSDFTVSGAGEVSTIGGPAITSVVTTNATPQFVLTGTTETIDFGLANLVLGSSLPNFITGSLNTGVGFGVLGASTTGANNTALGYGALSSLTTSSNNVAIGPNTLSSITTGQGENIAIGNGSLQDLTSGVLNTAIGTSTAISLTTGKKNVFIGLGAGNNYFSSESSNILVANNGVLAESNVIRIGTTGISDGQQNLCYIAGITGTTPVTGNAPQPVLCDNAGNLTVIAPSTSGFVYTSNGTATPSFKAPAAPAGTITHFDVLVGGAASAIASVGPGTAGQLFQSGGAAANPAYSTSTYPATNAVNTLLYASSANVMAALATANNGVLITSAAGVPSILAAGTTGQVLTATTGSPPSWAAAGGGGFGSPTYFQAYLTSNTNYATSSLANTVIFDTAISNVGSAYNTSTGVFTAPATGFYAFDATLFFGTGTGSTQFIIAYLGSVQSLRVAQLTVASAITSVAWAMPMTMGDTVQVQPFADGTGTFNLVGSPLQSGGFNTSSTFAGWRIA